MRIGCLPDAPPATAACGATDRAASRLAGGSSRKSRRSRRDIPRTADFSASPVRPLAGWGKKTDHACSAASGRRTSPPPFLRRTPEVFSGTPELFHHPPALLGWTRELSGGTPEFLRRTPALLRCLPELLRYAPEQLRRTPESLRCTPELLRYRPEPFRRASEIIPTHCHSANYPFYRPFRNSSPLSPVPCLLTSTPNP